MRFWLKPPKIKPIIKTVEMGRRALGEGWMEFTWAVKDDVPQIVERKPVEAPPGGEPIFVPGMGELSLEHVDFLMEKARREHYERGRGPEDMSPREWAAWVNNAWLEWLAAKVKAYEGVSLFGPGGHTQREKPDLRKAGYNDGHRTGKH